MNTPLNPAVAGPERVDPDLLEELRAAAAADPAVDRAVAVVRREAVTGPARVPAPAATEPTVVPEPVAAPPPQPDPVDLPVAEAFGGPLAVTPHDPATLQDALRLAAELAPDRGVTYLAADGTETGQSYPELLADAEHTLAGLRAHGLAPGDAVLFQFADNRNFITAFWACVLGGFLPTPVGTPLGFDRDNAVVRKLRAAWDLLDRPLVLTDRRLLAAAGGLAVLWGVDDLRLAAVEDLAAGAADTDWFRAGPDDPALHLLTSGSTGVPKCVRHAHRSILARTFGGAQALGLGADDVTLNWMPLDHVGGIVMCHVTAVVLGHRYVDAPIEAFLAEPTRWMEWAHRYRASHTWAPNFAFSLFNEHIEAASRQRWDLSCLRRVVNGGEAVVSRTAGRFLRALTPYGLPADAMRPAYGMSEIASAITFSTLSATDRTAGTLRVHADSMGGRLREAAAGAPDTVTFTEVGPPQPGVRIRIVDAEDRPLPADHIGRLQVSGATVMTGYHRNDAADAAAFTADGWFATGDLAFLHEGRLTITGRDSDRIVIQGANLLSYDVESIVEQVPGTEVTFVAACGYAGPGSQTDELVVFFVPASPRPEEQRRTVAAIRSRLARDIGLAPQHVVPVPRDRFPKTASGKIQRSQLVRDLADGRFAEELRRVAAEQEAADGSLPEWFFDPVWVPAAAAAAGPLPDGPWLVVAPPGLPVGRIAPEGVEQVVVSPADAVTDADGVVEPLCDRPDRIGAVVHLAGLEPATGPVADQLDRGVLAVRELVQSLAAREQHPALVVLTRRSTWAAPGDGLDPARAALPGWLRTVAVEGLLPLVRHVDTDTDTDPAEIAKAELARPGPDVQIAYRSGARLVRRLCPVRVPDRLPDRLPDRTAVLRPAAFHLVTGGLGGIGFEVAQYLLAAYGARLLVIGRSAVAESDGRKGRRLAELRELGEVEYRAVDVADPDGLAAAVAERERGWGPLTGVLHLAGADASGQWTELERHAAAREPRAAFTDQYRAKVHGTLALARLLESRPDTALVLFSSVNGDFGGSSFGAYSSANGFLGGFADHWGRERGRPVRCLAWSMWADTGMNRGAPTGAAAARGFHPIDVPRALESLQIALALDHPRLLIGLDGTNPAIVAELADEQVRDAEVVLAVRPATGSAAVPLDERLRAELAATIDRSPVPVRILTVPELPTGPDGRVDVAVLLAMAVAGRPGGDPDDEPVTDLERTLCALWAEVLDRGRVGRTEEFFALGGSSLRATQLVACTNSALGTALLVHQLYEYPNVALLAPVLEKDIEPGGQP